MLGVGYEQTYLPFTLYNCIFRTLNEHSSIVLGGVARGGKSYRRIDSLGVAAHTSMSLRRKRASHRR